MLIVSAHFAASSVAFAGASELSQVMDEEVCSALEAAEEARALLPALLSAFDNHAASCYTKLLDLASRNPEDGTVRLKQMAGGQQEWDKVSFSETFILPRLTRGPILGPGCHLL